ncbi:glycerol-3-phosphate cytidylyltransferase [Paenibacillus rhizosphaerae]|uniref:Glycerol-3-phosphate cytidylyltransferase n=1 Tax=Paenibacillus rhizosphaerae TaxID=297318 RepID=A0A839TVL3_9BACL|nr:glycerol-3-phosphate cytidylyltransferase [Paenibacillus rhizosphaerae]MBB3130896.1 glycerol-3-phosphate cytidylyltransferase [Paenibacillus rhizosphaerae]
MRKVITYGTFDLLHYGHILLLKRAKSLGDHLTVGLSTDSFNELKGKKSFLSFEQRKNLLESIKYIDRIIPEENWEQKSMDIVKYGIDVFVIGDDWKGKFDNLNCEVVYFPRAPDISSSQIKELMGNF